MTLIATFNFVRVKVFFPPKIGKKKFQGERVKSRTFIVKVSSDKELFSESWVTQIFPFYYCIFGLRVVLYFPKLRDNIFFFFYN